MSTRPPQDSVVKLGKRLAWGLTYQARHMIPIALERSWIFAWINSCISTLTVLAALSGKPRVACANLWHPPPKTSVGVLLGTCQSKENDLADWLGDKKTSQVTCILVDVKCWGTWDTTCGHNAKDLGPLNTCWYRKMWSSLKAQERAITDQLNTGTVSKVWGECVRDRVQLMGFSTHNTDTTLNWNEP